MLMRAKAGPRMGNHRGLTLLELLVAMLVLLVGIYTVARGFPTMLNLIRGEGDRTTMARLAEKEMERYARDGDALPDAITGGGSISPYDVAEDALDEFRPPNAQDNVLDVIGETFRVPAAFIAPGQSYVPGTSGQYVLRQGPALWTDPTGTGGMPYVYLLIPLEEQRDDPNLPGSPGLARNSFFVNVADGDILVPPTAYNYDGAAARGWSVDEIVVDYAWSEPGAPGSRPLLHYVQGETVNDLSGTGPVAAKVHPAHLPAGSFGQLIAGQTRVWAKHYFAREPFGTAYPAQPGWYVLENKYGVTLRFHPQDTGLTLKVDYRLRTDVGDRRKLLMMEEQVISGAQTRVDAGGAPFADVRLSLRNLDDGVDLGPVFEDDVQGISLPPGEETNILAVDMVDGNVYVEGTSFTLSDPNLLPMVEDGYRDGLLALPLTISGAPAPYVGHPMRFYYRTLNRHNLQMQKAPRSFVDRRTAESYQATYLGYLGGDAGAAEAASLAEVDYRSYELTYEPPSGSNALRVGVLTLGQWLDEDGNPGTPPLWSEALNCAGMTVAVNYTYWTGNPAVQKTVWGEMHTFSTGGNRVALNCATLADDGSTPWDDYPITILAVNGVSARMRAWWLNDKGVQKQADIESCFLPTALGLLPRVR